MSLDKQVISVPRIDGAITSGQGAISGNFTVEEANNLAVQLRYGSLPVPLKVVTSQTVGPTLGQELAEQEPVCRHHRPERGDPLHDRLLPAAGPAG